MTDWDQQWQDRITKVVRRVARDLIANDESEISEVVRRRLFENLGSARIRKRVAKAYATGASNGAPAFPPNGWRSTPRRLKSRQGNFSEAGSRRAIPSIPRPFRSFKESGGRYPSFSRPVGPLPCSRNGSPGPLASCSTGRARSR